MFLRLYVEQDCSPTLYFLAKIARLDVLGHLVGGIGK